MHQTRLFGRVVFIRYKTNTPSGAISVIHNNFANRMSSDDDDSFKFLPYQLSMVG